MFTKGHARLLPFFEGAVLTISLVTLGSVKHVKQAVHLSKTLYMVTYKYIQYKKKYLSLLA